MGNIPGGFGGGGGNNVSYYADAGGGGGYSGGGGSSPGPSGGGGSYNSGNNQENIENVGSSHGFVRIFRAENVDPGKPRITLLSSNWNAKSNFALIEALGTGYRFATPAEVTKAREAATPGAVNNWTASVQVKPRNLPGSVNEYGFDVQTTSGYWVIKE
jgi:hypothetical protein